MTSAEAARTRPEVEPAQQRASRAEAASAIGRLAVRLLRRGTAVVAVVVAGMSAFVVLQYRLTVESMDLGSLSQLAANPAVRTLFGVPLALDDAGGFTVWRTGTPVAVLVSAWALLAATRVMRGEEESRHWNLLLSGPVPLHVVVLRHLVVLMAAQAVVGGALAVALLAAGTRAPGALLYAGGITLVGTTFAAVGALTAQLVPDRRLAAGIGGTVIGAALLVRMVADGVDALAWLTWSSPYGVLARAQPFAGDRPLPLVMLVAMSTAAAVAALAVARRRDAEAGLWSPPSTRAPRLAWMRSPFRFALHRMLRPFMFWAAGLAAYFGLVGSLATSMTQFLTENPRFAEMASKAGVTDLGAVEGYAAALLGLLALPIGAFVAGMISDDAEDESSRRFAMLFALPMSRARWAASHAAVAVLACLALAIVAGVALWAGTAVAGAGLTLWSSLAGALNAVPVALVCLGAALLALGWAPRAVFAIGSLPAVGGFLLLVFADTFGWPGWVRAVSPFAHVADVPATPVDASGTVALLIVACLLGGAGVWRYAKRDLQG